MTWDDRLAGWWLGEVASDPAYREVVVPALLELLDPEPGSRYLDLGCGEGQAMRAVAASGGRPVGCDASPTLAALAASAGPVAVARLPDLSWVAPASLDGAYAVLVLEHLEDHRAVFEAAAGAVRPGGCLVVVSNHPVYTSPGSVPVFDPADDEVLWRWGSYLESGATEVPAGELSITFHHRPLGSLLSAAAATGWRLERLVEHGVGEQQAAGDALLARQRHIPRLMGVRWRRDAPAAPGVVG